MKLKVYALAMMSIVPVGAITYVVRLDASIANQPLMILRQHVSAPR